MVDSKQKSYEDQLSEFEGELRVHVNDEAMLQEIHSSIRSMLAGDGASENTIRNILQQQYDRGDLREESFQLVQKLIDRIVTEDVPTAIGVEQPFDNSDDLDSTAIIEAPQFDSASPGQRLQVGSVLRDRFLLQEEIASGSMGVVYKALDRRLAEADAVDPWVAIKVLTPQLSTNGTALRALQQEAAKTRYLTHPNIVRFIDLDREDDLYFMVMEWLDGRTLAQILDDTATKKIDLVTTLDIVGQVGKALQYAHKLGVVHADIKPGNVMILPDGDVKLIDFGVARIEQKQRQADSDFDPSILKAATPAYSSMQVLTGDDPVPADDVFSLACLTYRLIAGYRVFGPRNAAEAAEEGMEPQRLGELSERQWKALRKALAFSRVTRYASPQEFVEDMKADGRNDTSVEEPPITVHQDDQVVVAEVPARSSPWRYVVVLLIFVAGVAIVMEEELRNLFQSESTVSPIPSADAESTSFDIEDRAATSIPQGHVDGSKVDDVQEAESIVTDLTSGSQSGEQAPLHDEAAIQRLPDDHVEPNTVASDDIPSPADTAAAEQPTNTSDTISDGQIAERAATLIVPLAGPGEEIGDWRLTIVENEGAVMVDFVRDDYLEEELSLQLVETNFTGNQSPLASGQYSISNDGGIVLSPGQHKARLTIEMAPDPVREADREVQLSVRDARYADNEMARIKLQLLDDDQRAFENSLAANTIAFAMSQVAVRENDSVVQIDLVRYKPDQTAIDIAYTIVDVTATEGEDYFDPGSKLVSFAPGQRSARIMIPLVQDVVKESSEAFMLELQGNYDAVDSNIYRRIAVMIRDDDS